MAAKPRVEIPTPPDETEITLYIEVVVSSMEVALEVKGACESYGSVQKCVAKFDDPVLDLMD